MAINPHDLICQLTGKPVLDEDAVLLINANEILARDGIHGKIAPVGIGFGTGRHTEGRRMHEKTKGFPDSTISLFTSTVSNTRSTSAHNKKLFSRRIPDAKRKHTPCSYHSRSPSREKYGRSPMRMMIT